MDLFGKQVCATTMERTESKITNYPNGINDGMFLIIGDREREREERDRETSQL